MKAKLAKIVERIIDMRDAHYDDEFVDELDNALIALEAASDRLIALDEEEEDEDEDTCYVV